MTLGEKIKAARLELGLSQRQLCGGKITRNMLSQIENGSARPSMDTLSWLAKGLGKSVSYFLEEQAVVSPNMEVMASARQAYRAGDSRKALELLEDFSEPDMLFEQERLLLEFLCCLHRGRQALQEERLPYALSVLNRAEGLSGDYICAPLLRQLRLLQSMAGLDVPLCDDEILLQRAKAAADPGRKLELLAACEDKASPCWHFLAAEAFFAKEDYALAADHYRLCEQAYPEKVWPRLEQCCKELGDYKGAYEYACKQK